MKQANIPQETRKDSRHHSWKGRPWLEQKTSSKEKNKLPDEIKYTKEQINSMKLKSLNRIKIKTDDLYKNVDRNKHYMREGFKSIQDIIRW